MKAILRRGVLVLAIGALAALGWVALQPLGTVGSAAEEVTIWTQGAAETDARPGLNVALPGTKNIPARVRWVPDVAYVRRAYPKLRHVRLLGNGVDAADAASLRGLAVTWERDTRRPPAPTLVALNHPRWLAIGDSLTVEGAIAGVRDGQTIMLTLEGPGGTTQPEEIRGMGDGPVPFAIRGTPTVAAGRFEWALRVGSARDAVKLGASVSAPRRPRVLILQESPATETARLQRWLAESGGAVTMRTRVSAEHVRWTVANEGRGEFGALDAAVLREFDLVMVSDSALAALQGREREALEGAVRKDGLGVLVTGEARPGTSGDFFRPWAIDSEAEGEPRLARLRLAGGVAIDEPVETLASELPPQPLMRWVARDPHARTLVAAVQRGRGVVARSIVTDTWRWLQRGYAEEFAIYWAEVMSAVARRDSAEGTWRLERQTAPIFVDEPVHSSKDGGRSVYWPAQEGWNKAVMTDGAKHLPVFAHGREMLEDVHMQERRRTTALLLTDARAPERIDEPATLSGRADKFAAWAFLLFVFAAGGLWLEERRRRNVE